MAAASPCNVTRTEGFFNDIPTMSKSIMVQVPIRRYRIVMSLVTDNVPYSCSNNPFQTCTMIKTMMELYSLQLGECKFLHLLDCLRLQDLVIAHTAAPYESSLL